MDSEIIFVNGEKFSLMPDRRFPFYKFFPVGTKLVDLQYSPPREVLLVEDEEELGVTVGRLQPYANYQAVTKDGDEMYNKEIKCLYLLNLPQNTTSSMLRKFFAVVGYVEQADAFVSAQGFCNGRGCVVLSPPELMFNVPRSVFMESNIISVQPSRVLPEVNSTYYTSSPRGRGQAKGRGLMTRGGPMGERRVAPIAYANSPEHHRQGSTGSCYILTRVNDEQIRSIASDNYFHTTPQQSLKEWLNELANNSVYLILVTHNKFVGVAKVKGRDPNEKEPSNLCVLEWGRVLTPAQLRNVPSEETLLTMREGAFVKSDLGVQLVNRFKTPSQSSPPQIAPPPSYGAALQSKNMNHNNTSNNSNGEGSPNRRNPGGYSNFNPREPRSPYGRGGGNGNISPAAPLPVTPPTGLGNSPTFPIPTPASKRMPPQPAGQGPNLHHHHHQHHHHHHLHHSHHAQHSPTQRGGPPSSFERYNNNRTAGDAPSSGKANGNGENNNGSLVPQNQTKEGNKEYVTTRVHAQNKAKEFYRKTDNSESYGYYYNSAEDPNFNSKNGFVHQQVFFTSSSSNGNPALHSPMGTGQTRRHATNDDRFEVLEVDDSDTHRHSQERKTSRTAPRQSQPVVEEPDDMDEQYYRPTQRSNPSNNRRELANREMASPFDMHRQMIQNFFGDDDDFFGGPRMSRGPNYPNQRGAYDPTSFADQMMFDMQSRHRMMMDAFMRF